MEYFLMTAKCPLRAIQLFILFVITLPITQAFSSEAIHILSEKQQQTYSQIESNSYSEAMPIKQLINNLKGAEIKNGDFAFTHNQFEIGHRWGAFEVALFWRYDYFLTFSPDTAWLFYLDNNVDANSSNNNHLELKNYNVRLNANHIQSQGAAVGYSFYLLPELAVKTRLNYFNSSDMTDGSLSGNITTSADDYTGTLDLNYAYKRDSLLNREEESISGHGVGLDIDIFWQVTERMSFFVQGRDVFSYIEWSDVTYTQATAITDRVSYDENGLINVVPNISGINAYRNQIQRLPSRYLFDLNYHLENWQLATQLYRYENVNFPRLKFGSREKVLNWHVGYDFKTRAVELGIEHSNISFKVKSESLDWDKAHDFALSLSVNYVIE